MMAMFYLSNLLNEPAGKPESKEKIRFCKLLFGRKNQSERQIQSAHLGSPPSGHSLAPHPAV